MDRCILHVDINNFYASVECLYNPEIRNSPVAVTGNPDERKGIILAKNMIAKKMGVKTGETIWQARKKCLGLICVPPQYDRYKEYSRLAKKIYEDYTYKIESFGLDECWLDITSNTSKESYGEDIAKEIKERIFLELGVTVSIGVSFNKIFAKLGSDYKKPDAITVIKREDFKKIIWPLECDEMIMIGKKTKDKLRGRGIITIGDLAAYDREKLLRGIGKNGGMIWDFANGLDISPVSNIGYKNIPKSLGNSTTLSKNIYSKEMLLPIIYRISENLSTRLIEEKLLGGGICLHIKSDTLEIRSGQKKLYAPTVSTSTIVREVMELMEEKDIFIKPVRSIGIKIFNLQSRDERQIVIGDEINNVEENLEEVIYSLRKRFGKLSVTRGITLVDKSLETFDFQGSNSIFPTSYFIGGK